MNVEFILGEQKYIDFTVTSKTDEVFVIASANYELKDGSEIISSGQCDLEDKTISVLLEPLKRGRFILEISYVIPPETRKARVLINVT